MNNILVNNLSGGSNSSTERSMPKGEEGSIGTIGVREKSTNGTQASNRRKRRQDEITPYQPNQGSKTELVDRNVSTSAPKRQKMTERSFPFLELSEDVILLIMGKYLSVGGVLNLASSCKGLNDRLREKLPKWSSWKDRILSEYLEAILDFNSEMQNRIRERFVDTIENPDLKKAYESEIQKALDETKQFQRKALKCFSAEKRDFDAMLEVFKAKKAQQKQLSLKKLFVNANSPIVRVKDFLKSEFNELSNSELSVFKRRYAIRFLKDTLEYDDRSTNANHARVSLVDGIKKHLIAGKDPQDLLDLCVCKIKCEDGVFLDSLYSDFIKLLTYKRLGVEGKIKVLKGIEKFWYGKDGGDYFRRSLPRFLKLLLDPKAHEELNLRVRESLNNYLSKVVMGLPSLDENFTRVLELFFGLSFYDKDIVWSNRCVLVANVIKLLGNRTLNEKAAVLLEVINNVLVNNATRLITFQEMQMIKGSIQATLQSVPRTQNEKIIFKLAVQSVFNYERMYNKKAWSYLLYGVLIPYLY